MHTVALYLRSSKDRSDVSIDAQRRTLQGLAHQRQLTITAEYVDAVESGKDEHRPGFQRLVRDLKARTRAWRAVMLLDTSRLSRNIYVAEVFKHECRRRDVRIIYANLPESNPITDLAVVQILQAFDQIHSMMSREKGLAGMAENVRKGFRAGGRAPWGYQLEAVATSAMRDGVAVTKSRLIQGREAPVVQAYLRGRAAGKPRAALMRDLAITREPTSLNGTEWNALTYAGHTIWNVHNEHTENGYKNGQKRRPRSEWVIQRNTHEAIITDEEAEALLARLDRRTNRRQRISDYLLAGLLTLPDGTLWHGDAGRYRAGNRRIVAHAIESAVVRQIAADWRTPEFVSALLAAARESQGTGDDGAEVSALQRRRGEVERSIHRITALLEQTTAVDSLLRKLEMLEAERKHADDEIADATVKRDQIRAIKEITESDVAAMLNAMADNLDELDRPLLKDLLAQVVKSVELDPDSNEARINYQIPINRGVNVASPGGYSHNTTLSTARVFQFVRPAIGRRRKIA